jgi:hypothetical protein
MGHNTDAFLSRPHNFSSSSSCVSIKGAGTGWWSRRDTLKRDAMHKKRKKEKSSQSSSSSSPGGITGFRVEEKKKIVVFPERPCRKYLSLSCVWVSISRGYSEWLTSSSWRSNPLFNIILDSCSALGQTQSGTKKKVRRVCVCPVNAYRIGYSKMLISAD